jgi:hypothetical protein
VTRVILLHPFKSISYLASFCFNQSDKGRFDASILSWVYFLFGLFLFARSEFIFYVLGFIILALNWVLLIWETLR